MKHTVFSGVASCIIAFTEIPEQIAALFYILKMDSAKPSEKSTNYYQATSLHISEDSFLHSQRHENLKFHLFFIVPTHALHYTLKY
jgi:hypothetical protein